MLSRRALAIGIGGIVWWLSAVAMPAEGEGQKPNVSLALEGVYAERSDGVGNERVIFECRVNLTNDTGAELMVRSNFFSIYDGLALVLFGGSGETLVEQPYVWHQSPYSSQGRTFPVARGANRAALAIPIDLKPGVRKVKAQIVGVLPGSDRAGVLASNLADVAIVPRAARGPLPGPNDVRSMELERREPAANRPVSFAVPAERWASFFDALTPVKPGDKPANGEVLGTLKVVGWDEIVRTITLYRVGPGPGAFSIRRDGGEPAYHRGGTSEALIKAFQSAREAHAGSSKSTPRP